MTMTEKKEKKIRVAIVGSGLAGLTTAYLLTHDVKKRYEVEIFEAGPSPSLDAASTTVTLPGSRTTIRLDVPMRAFAGGFYKNLLSLYAHLGIPYRRQNFLYAFSAPASPTYHIHPSNLHRFPPRPAGVTWLAHIVQLAALWIVYTYFTLCTFHVAPAEHESLRSYLRRIRIPDTVTRSYLLPLFSAVATCTHDALLDFPASDIVDYRKAVYAQPHYVVAGGVGAVQERLLAGTTIHFNRRVDSVDTVSTPGAATLTWNSAAAAARFDRVVLAVNPKVAAEIYAPLSSTLERIPCCDVDVVVHTDAGLLRDLAPPGATALSAATQLLGRSGAQLIHLSTKRAAGGGVQTQASHLYLPGVVVTTQPHGRVRKGAVVGGATFTRVLRSCESRELVREVVETQGGRAGVWVVGGWAWDGMVLLEGCVVSAKRVAGDFGVEVEW